MGIIPTDERGKNLMAVGIFAFVLAGAFQWFVVKKRNAEAVLLEAAYMKLDSLNVDTENRVRRMGGVAAMQKQVGMYREHMKVLERLIPQKHDVPDLLYAIAEQAQIAHVIYDGIHPELEEPTAYYSRQTYTVKVRGAYHDIGTYLTNIAGLPRIIKVSDLKMSVSDAPVNSNGSPILSAEFTIETYVVPGPGDIVADTGKKGI